MNSDDIKYMRRLRKYDLSEQDKCDATFSVRIPIKTKYLCDQLDAEEKTVLIEAIKVTIAEVLHEANFDPIKYLKT